MKRLLLTLSWLFALTTIVWAQSRTVTGTVISAESRQPLSGAIVIVKGSTSGAFSDENGKFSILVPDQFDVIQASHVGYARKEVALVNQDNIEIILVPKASTLDEVVVVGFTTQKRSQITGAVSTVTSEEVNSTPIQRLDQAIQGRAAGVNITQNSGSPGSGLTVRIRGIGTINNSDPLYIIDGLFVDGGGLNNLNPADIESISILKDAASTAIYGAAGANGVVIITTKSGRINQDAVVEYNGYFGIQEPWKKLNLLNAREYAILQNESNIAAGQTINPDFANPDTLGEGTNWQDAVFSRTPTTSHSLSARGGGEVSTYAFTASYLSQQGIIGAEKSNFNRLSLRLNTDYQLRKNVNAGTRVNFTHLNRSALPENNEFSTPLIRALNMDPTSDIMDEDGNFLPSQYLDTDIFNPVAQIDRANGNYRSERLIGGLFLDYQPVSTISFRSNFNIDIANDTQDDFFPSYFLSINDQNPVNSVQRQFWRYFNYQWDNTLTFEQTFRQKHKFLALLGNTIINNNVEFTGAGRNDLTFNDPDFAILNNGSQDIANQFAYGNITNIGGLSKFSVFARLNYEYDETYLLNLVYRYDGSSNFGPNNAFGSFPSASFAWVVSNENFLQSTEWIYFLKLRTSYGSNGNDRIPQFQYLERVGPTAGGNGSGGTYSYVFGPANDILSGRSINVRPNADIRWEATRMFNIGVDAGLFNDALYFSADYFIRWTDGMLVVPEALGHVGAVNSFVNAGSMRNNGLELAGEYRNRTGALEYKIGGNIAFISNELTSLGNGGTPLSTGFLQPANGNIARTEVGFPIAYFYGFETDGIFQNQEEVASHAFQQDKTGPGDLRFVDQNGDEIINEEDRTIIGNPTPDFTYGINGGLSYEGIDFSFFLFGVQGNEIYRGYTRNDFENVNQPNFRLNRWTGEGTTNEEPRVISGDPNQNARVSDYFVEDGSFLKIRNIQVGYTLPKSVMDRIGLNKIRVYGSGQNIFAFTEYSGLDPEIGTRGTLEIGIDRGFYPAPRIWSGGIQVIF